MANIKMAELIGQVQHDKAVKQVETHRVHLQRLTHSLLLKFLVSREARLRKVGFSSWAAMVQEERLSEGRQRTSLGVVRGVILRVTHRSQARALSRWKDTTARVREMVAGQEGAMRRVCSLMTNRSQRALLGSLHRYVTTYCHPFIHLYALVYTRWTRIHTR